MTNFQVCRCCLLENPAYTYNIFGDTAVDGKDCHARDTLVCGVGLRAALLTCVPNLHLAFDDGLSAVICDHCFSRLRDTLEFRRRCEESESELRRRYADTERAIDEALRLVNFLDTKGVNAAENFGCCQSGLQHTGELGPNELAMLDDLLQLEEHNLKRVWDGTLASPNEENAALKETTDRAVEEVRLLNDTPMDNDMKSVAAVATIEKHVNPKTPVSPPSHTDSSASNTDCSSLDACQTRDVSLKSLHPCPECEKKFTRKFQLRLHMISVHNLGDGLQYECNECYKTFASRHSLSYHQRSVHSDERPFACTHCDRRFILRTQLSSHLRIHTGETIPRTFECLECSKRWRTKSDLRTHMRTHVKVQERPFKCDQCEKAFFTRGHLNSHLLVHSGEKPFACPTCGKSYQCVGNLNNHMARQHDFERGLGRGRSANVENAEI
ncbi:PREDICTED: zinc finger protein 182-like [Rhagoletis zephyria]|uniref:zinc finger protein 182-like n=1 Tax=Rhagoletis zephyria TaxID=28612 RepID=UPI0008118A0B|nr:PREDICTED: zinc finger protein 182-like [Rhagoletis zephyria]